MKPVRPFAERVRIVRHDMRRDILLFGLPAIVVFVVGLVLSRRDGYDGLVRQLFRVILDPGRLQTMSAANIAGLAMLVVGLSIAIPAALTLGMSYASTLVIRQEHRLVTSGIYRFVRHPIYAGAFIAILGAPVYATSLSGFLVLMLLLPLLLGRIRREEALLISAFGDAYRAYRRSTKMLIPGVW